MAWSAVSSAINTIDQLVTQEAIYLGGVEEQVYRLRRELKWMQIFVLDADVRQGENVAVRLWVAEIRDLAYDVEDVVEAFALRIGSKRAGGFSKVIKRSACIFKKGWMLLETRSKIEKIMERITLFRRGLQIYGIRELSDREGSSSSSERQELIDIEGYIPSSERQELRRPYPPLTTDYIPGFDDEIRKLVSILVDKESHYQVVSICGMGDLEKTTLAKGVNNHSQVRDHFKHIASVYVSERCQRRNVFEGILSSFGMLLKEDKKKSDDELGEKMRNFLKDNTCLVTLDDICCSQDWDSLKAAFPMTDTTSKMLFLSRNKEISGRGIYLYELSHLNEEESWELFQKTVFPNRDSPDYRANKRMEELGRKMVEQCAGVPSTIILLGGILAFKYSLNEWKVVFERVHSNLKRANGQADDFSISYDDLPSYLKPCFLYLIQFPNDYEIYAERLIQLWVAEGIISSTQEEGNEEEVIEDVAERYLIELVQRRMIQVEESDVATLKIKTFRINRLMRDFCLSKAKEENFLFVIDESIGFSHGNSVLSSTIDRVWRVAAHNCFQIQCIKSPHLRSLLVFNDFFPDKLIERSVPLIMRNYIDNLEDDEGWNPLVWIVELLVFCIVLPKYKGIWTYMFNNLKLLRVLDFEGKGNHAGIEIPSDIGNLIHLRFLSLRDLTLLRSKLPSALGNLWFLQTLDLRVKGEWDDPIHVPNVIWRLKQLRHLYLPEKLKHETKLKLHTLRNLQTLVNFNTKSCYVEDLHKMTNLKELEIRGPFNIEALDLDKNAPVIGSKYLQSLSIFSHDEEIDPSHLARLLSSCVSICKLTLEADMGKLPEHHHFSEAIAYIYLSASSLAEDPMPTLERLHNLRILVLNSAFTGNEMICSAQGFPRLDSLSLRDLQNLEEWKLEEGAMPALRHLEIASCKNLKMLPDGLSFITTLQELKIEWMPKAFKDKLLEGEEDFYKVQHVPSIEFLHSN